MLTSPSSSTGLLAAKFAGLSLPLQVLRSGAGYYIGTQNEEGPVSRESVEYFSTQSHAEHALKQGTWSQREQA
ncbi:hypothetical protein ORE12_002282 [Salmonella enterica subsp. enterica serovar Newport]|nr:hypothetical protein [Salmonella enterica subsp. enterica serovar Stanley]EAS1640416.1 hypothetical protein [Salmonella enterica]EBS4494610.1 hypothetical protein [Salmonella enterica subsp. enterica serovar Agona]EBV0925474.1 hypothetical protein [Salmonella enterica subsp. enterica serovar Newport]EBV2761895.1 hypothetical protein [Salmonella enterica subsp. enterica serovar Weltevreden]EDL4196957.1 hypothetical protein [Salmonella enterica subsp. enterica serovar Infantis]EDT1787914.1 h